MGSPEQKGFGQGSPRLARWALETFAPEDDVLREVRERAARAGLPPIHVGPMDGLHLEVIARACGARRAVEIGTLAGYSGVCLARGLAAGGTLHTFERDPRHAEVARETFARAGVDDRVVVHVGPALEGLRTIERLGPFDLVFIDADKGGYPAYLAWAAEHVRLGGVVLGDNAFGFGHVADPPSGGDDAASATVIRAFDEALARGGRFRATMLPTEEGLAMGVKVR